MVEIASRDPLLVFSNWACFILFQFCFTGSSLLGIICIVSPHDLLGMVRIVSFHVSLVLHYRVWRVLFHFPHFVIITGHSVYCFMSSFIGSSLLGIDHIVSFHDSLVLPYRAWFELFHFMLCWLLLNGLVYIVSLQALLVHYHSYIALFVLFHFPYWFIILFVVCVISLHSSLVHDYWAWLLVFHFMTH